MALTTPLPLPPPVCPPHLLCVLVLPLLDECLQQVHDTLALAALTGHAAADVALGLVHRKVVELVGVPDVDPPPLQLNAVLAWVHVNALAGTAGTGACHLRPGCVPPQKALLE